VSWVLADLEFCSDVNAGADGDALVDSLLADVAGALARHFEISLPPECVLELDSSTPAKFSRHIIVRLPGAAFETNRDAGAFVGQLLGSDAQNGPLGVAKVWREVVRDKYSGFAELTQCDAGPGWASPRIIALCCKGVTAMIA